MEYLMGFIWFCAAGYSFFCGIIMLISAILFSMISTKLWQKLLVYIATLIGICLIFMSATPFYWLFYIAWGGSVLGWLMSFAFKKKPQKTFSISMFILVFCLTVLALVMELPFCLKPSMPKQKIGTLYVVGDSISGGIGGKSEQTWPKIFRKDYGVNVINLAESGATVGSAIRQAVHINSEKAMVLLEIGGNDFFGPTPYPQFRRELEQLLKQVSGSERTIVMLEMPSFPWQMEYGRIQRQLAKQFDAILIPKRFLVNVLSVKDVSPDLAHLTPKGHDLMAKEIWSILGESLQPTLPKTK